MNKPDTPDIKTPHSGQERYVLIVEDSPIDFEIISRSFAKAGFIATIYRCSDGDEALDFLKGKNDIILQKGNPALVLLDLNLPGTDGREVLSNIKSDNALKEIPVIILSTSNNDNDIEYCFTQGADKYFKKPISPDDFLETINVIKKFWDTHINVEKATPP